MVASSHEDPSAKQQLSDISHARFWCSALQFNSSAALTEAWCLKVDNWTYYIEALWPVENSTSLVLFTTVPVLELLDMPGNVLE